MFSFNGLEFAKLADDNVLGVCLISQAPPNSTSKEVVFVHDNLTCELFNGSICKPVGFSGTAVRPKASTVISVGLALRSPFELIV